MNINNFGIDVGEISTNLTEKLVDDQIGDPSKALLPVKVQKERLRFEILNILQRHFENAASGIQSLLERLNQMTNRTDEPLDRGKFESILDKLALEKSNELNDEELTVLFNGAIDLYNTQALF